MEQYFFCRNLLALNPNSVYLAIDALSEALCFINFDMWLKFLKLGKMKTKLQISSVWKNYINTKFKWGISEK
jgi:hypothetical protein